MILQKPGAGRIQCGRKATECYGHAYCAVNLMCMVGHQRQVGDILEYLCTEYLCTMVSLGASYCSVYVGFLVCVLAQVINELFS